MDAELELLRRRVEFLEQRLFEYLEQIASLQYRIAELERRPATLVVEPEREAEPEPLLSATHLKAKPDKLGEVLLSFPDHERLAARRR